jgi:hypothetical protein
MSALSLWLAYWLFFIHPDLNATAIAISPSLETQPPAELLFQERDAALVDPGKTTSWIPGEVAKLKSAELAATETGPAIVYLSVPGVGRLDDPAPGGSGDHRSRLSIAPEVFQGPRASAGNAAGNDLKDVLDLNDIFDEFRNRPGQNKLLILDIRQIATDRKLGLFLSDFADRLKRELDRRNPENFTVLASCAPGQFSWSSDADGHSVFAHFVADGLRQARDVRELVDYVQKNVSRWVKIHRGAIQTPISWGNPASNFYLPKPPETGESRIWGATSRPLDSPWKKQEAHDLWNRLLAWYKKTDGYLEQRPHRYAPLAWREYLETLLRAERLYRAGLFQEGLKVITGLEGIEQVLRIPFALPPGNEYPSLEMGLRLASDPNFHPPYMGDAEWETALAWPPPRSVPVAGVKPKEKNAATKQGGEIVSSENADQPDASAPEKGKLQLPEFLRMCREGKNPWRDFVEGQLIDWAIDWTKSHPNSILFSQRADLFRHALKVRRLSERAASSSWQTGRLFDDVLEKGDAARRRAQDDLFAADQDTDGIEQHFKEAESYYEQAIKYGEAVDLIEQIRVEWPYLGGWKVRRAAAMGPAETNRTADFIHRFATRVAKLNSSLDPRNPREDSPDAPNASFEREYADVRQDFEQVKGEFNSAIAAQVTSGSWRQIDSVLGVPTIPAKDRKQLVERVVALSLEHALQKFNASQAARATPEAKPADGKSEAKPAESPSEPAEQSAGSALSADTVSEADEGSQPDGRREDPEFGLGAKGMAQLELSLLTIGGIDEMLDEPSRIRQALDDLNREIDSFSPGSGALDAAHADENHRDRICGTLRSLRRRLESACAERGNAFGDIKEVRQDNYRSVLALQRALLALPARLADETRFANLSKKLADFRITAVLLGQARRLLDDLDIGRADKLLKIVAGMRNEDAGVVELRKRLETKRAAKITISSKDVVLKGDQDKEKIEVSIEPSPEIPKGRAVLSFRTDAKEELKILRNDPAAASVDVTLGVGAEVNPAKPPAKLGYLVERGINVEELEGLVRNRGHAEKKLWPSLFYRGHTYPINPTDATIKIVLEPLDDVVHVALRESPIPKGSKDQFRYHPSDGYMHYNEVLNYQVVLTNLKDKDQTVYVEYQIEEDPEAKRNMTTILKGKSSRVDFSKVVFKDGVRGVDLKALEQKKPGTHEVDLGKPRYLQIDVWDSPARGRRLTATPKRFRFTHLDVKSYAGMVNQFYDAAEERVHIQVAHLRTDPCKGLLDMTASVANSSQGAHYGIPPDRGYDFYFGVDPQTDMVKWSVNVGKKINAFSGTLTINPNAKKEEEKNAETPKP